MFRTVEPSVEHSKKKRRKKPEKAEKEGKTQGSGDQIWVVGSDNMSAISVGGW
jgi:hypothetical protein